MKSAVTFVLFLLCSLFGGFGYGHPAPATALHTSANAELHVRKAFITTISNNNQLQVDTIADDEDTLSFVDDDDQDDVREHVLQPRPFLAFYHLFTSSYQHVALCPLPIAGHFCPATSTRKFILQRVLRI